MEEWHLTKGWEFKQSDHTEWMPVDCVPTNVHIDLIDNQMCVRPTCVDIVTANAESQH